LVERKPVFQRFSTFERIVFNYDIMASLMLNNISVKEDILPEDEKLLKIQYHIHCRSFVK